MAIDRITASDRSNWQRPLPERMARPTYWPAMLALGVTLALLGIVASLGVTVVGLALAARSVAGWIGETLHG